MSDQAWKKLISEEDVKGAGFELYSGDQTIADYEIIATVEVYQFTTIKLLYSAADSERLYMALGQESPLWLYLPVKPTKEALAEFTAQYVAPALAAKEHLSETSNPAAAIAFLKEAEGMVVLDDPALVSHKWYFGYGDYENDTVNLENGLLFSEWLAIEAERQATANGGQFSQWWTRYSHSLITLERHRRPDTQADFYVHVQYRPSLHADFLEKGLKANTPAGLSENVPYDMPLDVILLITSLAPSIFATREALLKQVKDGDLASIFPLAGMVGNAELEAVFAPMLDGDNEQLRDHVAAYAALYGQTAVVELAKQKGISENTQKFIEQFSADKPA